MRHSFVMGVGWGLNGMPTAAHHRNATRQTAMGIIFAAPGL
jgi:hypothetical protein